jgi:transcription-repair coupling factor (superfamily II helicase)
MELQLSSLVQSYLKSSEPYKSFKNNFAHRLYAENLEGYLLAEALSLYKKVYNANMWAICSTEMAAKELCKDLDVTNTPYIYLISNNKVLYSQWEGSSSEYAQLKALSSLLEKKTTLIVTHLRAFVSPLISPTAIKTAQLDLKINELFDPTTLASKLAEGGYYRSPTCTVPGEFSMHGEIFEIFPFENDYPIRIYADWDRIEKINTFDPFNQDTIKTLSNIKVNLIGDQDKKQIGSVKTYLKDDDYFFFIGKERLDNSFHSLTVEAKALYRQEFLINRDALKPNEILFDFPTFYANCNRSTTVIDVQGQMENSYKYNVDGPISFFGNFVMVKEHLSQLFANNYSVAIYAGSLLQKNRLTNMLKEFEDLVIFEEQISGGFTISEKRISVLCDHEIFGRRKQVVKALHKTQSSPLDSFVDLNEGDYVVHVNYGVGQFEKIDRLTMGSKERDYIKIIYANDERLFVPIEQANLIQRYIGSEGSKPKVDKLGGQSWEAKKAKARKAAEQLAKQLVQLYARRKSSKGYIYSKDTDWQLEFEASFPFDETEDQLVCIEDVKRDMESPLVMDRLICGDVGYGKTEIALRAAFKAVMDGKQVAFLAPTTILAEQHYKTLIERLGNFPVKAAVMSRMVSRKEQTKILENLEKGQLDILVGTHRLLQKDVIFKDLGLLIVDEEQRFGVKDKEKVKELKTNIDSLALSATPIPRTLYMSLLKIRDMSLLTTAPMERRPIKTFIKEFDLETIVKAINFEVERGGQVFYLHNRIDTIDEVVSMLQNQLPSSLVDSIQLTIAYLAVIPMTH